MSPNHSTGQTTPVAAGSKDSKDSKDSEDSKDSKDSKPPKKYELIDELPLHESVGGGKSYNTSVSVLQGVVRLERADDEKQICYRIVAAFQLQVKIHAFDKGYMKTVDRLFDFVSLRYLYKKDEVHEVLPNGDPLTKKVEVTEESANTASAQAAVSGTAPMPAITPSLTVQVGREKRLTVKRNVDAWRTGVSYESWCQRKPRGFEHQGEYHGGLGTRRRARHHHVFEVESQHKVNCSCPQNFGPYKCKLRDSNLYSRCVHWFWQVQAQPHFWTPEIYESVTFPITVTRIVTKEKLGQHNFSSEDAQRYFHFDFVLKTRLRELGWTLRDRLQPWRPRRPAEIRAKTDFGYPLGVEKVRFCIRACPEGIHWPPLPTENLQEEAYQLLFGPGAAPRRLGSEPMVMGQGTSGPSGPDPGTQRQDARNAEQLRLSLQVETRFHNMENRIAIDGVKRDFEALKDRLAFNSQMRRDGDPCRNASPRHHHHHHHRHHHHHHHRAPLHHTDDEPERYEYDRHSYQREGSPARYRRHYGSDADSDTEHIVETTAILRGRSRERRPYMMSGGIGVHVPVARDDHELEDWPRSPRRRGVRERSFTRTRTISVDARRRRARSPSSSSTDSTTDEERRFPPRYHRYDTREDEWEARIARRIDDLDERIRAQDHDLKARKKEEELKLKDELIRLRRRQEEAQPEHEGGSSEPPKRQVFIPGKGICPETDSTRITLVDHKEPAREPDRETATHHHHNPRHRRFYLGR